MIKEFCNECGNEIPSHHRCVINDKHLEIKTYIVATTQGKPYGPLDLKLTHTLVTYNLCHPCLIIALQNPE